MRTSVGWWRRKLQGPVAFWVDAFVVLNLAFLALDVLIAHAATALRIPSNGCRWCSLPARRCCSHPPVLERYHERTVLFRS